MRIIITVGEDVAYWRVTQTGKQSESGTIELGEDLSLETGPFRLLAAVVDEGGTLEDAGPVGHIDPATDKLLVDALKNVDM